MKSVVKDIRNNIIRFNSNKYLPINNETLEQNIDNISKSDTIVPIFTKEKNKWDNIKQIVILFVIYYSLYIFKFKFISNNKYIVGLVKSIIFICLYYINIRFL